MLGRQAVTVGVKKYDSEARSTIFEYPLGWSGAFESISGAKICSLFPCLWYVLFFAFLIGITRQQLKTSLFKKELDGQQYFVHSRMLLLLFPQQDGQSPWLGHFWRCPFKPIRMGNSFSSSIFVGGTPPCNLGSWGDGVYNAPIFAFWGQKLTLGGAVVVWGVIWVSLKFFHILWTCLNGKFFRSYIIVSQSWPCGFGSWRYGGTNAPTFASWGTELTSGAAIVIWGLPLSLAFCFIFFGPFRMENSFSSYFLVNVVPPCGSNAPILASWGW